MKKRAAPGLRSGELAKTLLWCFTGFLMLYFLRSPEMAAGSVRSALEVCGLRLIPSLFPFIVVMKLVGASGLAQLLSRLFGRAFGFFFGLPEEGTCAFLLGSLGGFPGGAVSARELFEEGRLTRDEAGRLAALSNNAGLAFCVGGVGSALLSSPAVGFLLWCVQLASAVLIGIASRRRGAGGEALRPGKASRKNSMTAGGVLKLVSDSVVSAGAVTVQICCFAIFFAVVGELLCAMITPTLGERAAAGAAALCELTLASRLCIASGGAIGLSLCAFALGFGGLSVQLQIAAVLSGSGISLKRCFFSKLAQGILSAVIVFLIIRLRSIG